jgi:hypothetical protein
MAATNLKESLQCLAFAYFADNTKVDSTHEEEWYNIFAPDTSTTPKSLRAQYKQYLSSLYSEKIFEQVIEKYHSTVTPKSGKVSVDAAVKKVYLVVKKVVDSNLFTSGLKNYMFLDQMDPFTIAVKDDSLKRIARAFNLSGKADLFSPADIFIVKRDKITEILSEYSKHVLNADDNELLGNMSWGTTGKNTYRTISNNFFKKRYLVAVSLKLPETISGAGVLKIVGTENVEPHLLDFIDPYTKLIAAMLAHPEKTSKLIDKVVDIEFDNFRITPAILSWEYPITFRYAEVMDPRNSNQALYKRNLRFKLFTWSNAGFNAQWYKGQGAPGNWTGGAGTESLGELFVKYNEYPQILKELVDIREKAFYFAIHNSEKAPNIDAKSKGQYNKALDEIRNPKILSADLSKNIIKFFSEYSPNSKAYLTYQTKVVKDTTKQMKKASTTVTTDPKRLNAHYVASQCAWFLFRGGETLHKHLKKRMFLSLFGLITKSGYKIFQGEEETVMEDFVMKVIQKNKKNVVAYFNSSPHIVLS